MLRAGDRVENPRTGAVVEIARAPEGGLRGNDLRGPRD